MKVRIVKCSDPRLWYSDAVGGEFNAVASIADPRNARVLSSPDETTIRFINHGDYEVVQPSEADKLRDAEPPNPLAVYTRQQADEWAAKQEEAAVAKIRAITREEINRGLEEDRRWFAELKDRVIALEKLIQDGNKWIHAVRIVPWDGVVPEAYDQGPML